MIFDIKKCVLLVTNRICTRTRASITFTWTLFVSRVYTPTATVNHYIVLPRKDQADICKQDSFVSVELFLHHTYNYNSNLQVNLGRGNSLSSALIVEKKVLEGNLVKSCFFFPNSGSFYLTDLYATDESELCDPTPVLNLNREEGKRPAVFLRFK